MSTAMVLRQPLLLRVVGSALLGTVALMLGPTGLKAGGAWAVVGLLGAVAVAVLAVRHWLQRVEISPERLTVVNLVRSYTLSWDEVERVPTGTAVGDVCVRLRNGHQVRVSAFADVPGALPLVRRRNQEAAQTLQQAVTRYRR